MYIHIWKIPPPPPHLQVYVPSLTHRPGNKILGTAIFCAGHFKILFKILVIESVNSAFQPVNDRRSAVISSPALTRLHSSSSEPLPFTHTHMIYGK